MKTLKKAVMGCSIVGLTLTLGACGQKESGKTTTMADILNGKEERKIVMTYDHGNGESPSVQWQELSVMVKLLLIHIVTIYINRMHLNLMKLKIKI